VRYRGAALHPVKKLVLLPNKLRGQGSASGSVIGIATGIGTGIATETCQSRVARRSEILAKLRVR